MNKEMLTQLTAASLTGLLANGQATSNGLNFQQVGALAVNCAMASLKEINRQLAIVEADLAAATETFVEPKKKK
jgi:hypothetical protein